MALQLDDCTFFGPALPEPFVKLSLEAKLQKKGLLAKTTGADGKKLQADWDTYRNRLRKLGGRGGSLRVFNQAIEPLAVPLGYATVEQQDPVATREGMEDGGWLLSSPDGSKLRVFAIDVDTDLDAPSRRGHAYRFSPSRIAQRVLLASGERVGLLTDGEELRILLCDPARPDSHIAISLVTHGGWRGARRVPDSYRLLLALCCAPGVGAIAELTEEARLSQTKVTEELRTQAQGAIVGFLQEILDEPKNTRLLAAHKDKQALARDLWREGLIMVYRLLFVFKLEASPDPARAFSFASTSLWRNTYSPNTALGKHARAVIDEGAETGALLESGMRTLFKMFVEGLESVELRVSPLGGALFGAGSTKLLDGLAWGERAVAHLLDQLLWTTGGAKKSDRSGRQRVHYGSLDVEDLGRVYEALLELEPGIATEDMCRLRRDKLEVVVPAAQGAPFRRGKNSKVEFADDIATGSFYLRVGLGRKSTGSYYTPHAFVRFLVQETLGPQIAERSPTTDPQPEKILALNVLDPAMGSGHFLVEACRFLGEQLYEACRLCDELALKEDERAKRSKDETKAKALARAAELRKRVEDLPDPNDELLAYLPSRVVDTDGGLSQAKALALCRRLVAVHCLYGVDKNRLAVELAKLSLWLESYAEGLPLTFLDHRLVCGDSLTGPFFADLARYPGSGESIDGLLASGLSDALRDRLSTALDEVRALEASIGKDVADLEAKRISQNRLVTVLKPFRTLAAAWTGGVMIAGDENASGRCDDGAYLSLVQAVASGRLEDAIATSDDLERMVELGHSSVSYDLAFPEVFFSSSAGETHGFDAVIGNPPWDRMLPADKEFFAAFDLKILDAPTKKEREATEKQLMTVARVAQLHRAYVSVFRNLEAVVDRTYRWQVVEVNGETTIGKQDAYRLFMERAANCLRDGGRVGLVVPSAFHANEGATGIRRLYLHELDLETCYSFENARRIFEIHSSFKFATIVARRTKRPRRSFSCAFYLHDINWLFAKRDSAFTYTLDFVQRTGGSHLTLLELRDRASLEVASRCYERCRSFADVAQQWGIRLGRELNMTDDAYRFVDTDTVLDEDDDPRTPDIAISIREQGYLPLHEGKTFHQFDDQWEERPRYVVPLRQVKDRADWLQATRYFRLVMRKVARSTDERTAILTVMPPGTLFGDSVHSERTPNGRSNANALLAAGLMNTFVFDWLIRQRGGANLNLFLVDSCPITMPNGSPVTRLLAHGALRLVSNSNLYASLWTEQLRGEWRETSKTKRWPAIKEEDDRWAVRSAIDAAVAHAYGLSRDEYASVLLAFSHKSYVSAAQLCLAAFDEYAALGEQKFCKRHDPYSDIPLVETVAEPMIDLGADVAEPGGSTKRRKTTRRAKPPGQRELAESE